MDGCVTSGLCLFFFCFFFCINFRDDSSYPIDVQNRCLLNA